VIVVQDEGDLAVGMGKMNMIQDGEQGLRRSGRKRG
jgi:hypothetical protein